MARQPHSATARRITLVADELLGYVRTGGVGTVTTHLAIGLARLGHEVEVLYVGPTPGPLDGDWSRLYEDAGVEVRVLVRNPEPVEPAYFAQMRDTATA